MRDGVANMYARSCLLIDSRKVDGLAPVHGDEEIELHRGVAQKFEQRVDSIEAALDEVDAGVDDPQKWIQIDDFMAAMRKEHPWL